MKSTIHVSSPFWPLWCSYVGGSTMKFQPQGSYRNKLYVTFCSQVNQILNAYTLILSWSKNLRSQKSSTEFSEFLSSRVCGLPCTFALKLRGEYSFISSLFHFSKCRRGQTTKIHRCRLKAIILKERIRMLI